MQLCKLECALHLCLYAPACIAQPSMVSAVTLLCPKPFVELRLCCPRRQHQL